MSRWLSREDVQRMTKVKRSFAAQRRRLDEMGVYYRLAADGEPLVTHEAADAVDGRASKARNSGPRWDRIGL